MHAIFSFEMWLILIDRFFSNFLPIIPVLLFFAWRERGTLKHSRGTELLLAFAFCDLSIRLLLFFGGIPYQGRYLHPLIIISCPFAALGFFGLLKFLESFSAKFKWLTRDNCIKVFCAVIIVAHGGKALSPPDRKVWLNEIPECIRKACPPGAKPVLISEFPDIRTAYYAGAEHLALERRDSIDYVAEWTFENDKDSLPGTTNGDEAVIAMKIRDDYPYGIGTVLLDGDFSGISGTSLYSKNKDGSWEEIGNSESAGKTRFLGFPGKELKLVLKGINAENCKLNSVRLVLDDRWRILRAGRGVLSGYRFTAVPPEPVGRFEFSLAEFGDRPVFVLNSLGKDEFSKLFEASGVRFPLDLVASFKDRKKGKYSLYKYKAKNAGMER